MNLFRYNYLKPENCRTVSVKDMQNGKRKVIFDAKEVLYGLKTPVVKDSQVCYENFFYNVHL